MRQRMHRRMIRRARVVAMVMAAAAVFQTTGCGALPNAPPSEEVVTDVRIQDLAFNPKEVTIRLGETVRWTNEEAEPIIHRVTSGRPGENAGALWVSGDLNTNGFFTHTFDEVGEFLYFCALHESEPDMVDAKVIVTPVTPVTDVFSELIGSIVGQLITSYVNDELGVTPTPF